MDLQNIERQRIKLYKQYLKNQIQKNSKLRKEQNSYQRKKQLSNINQLIDRLNQDDVRRLQQRKNMAILLKQHNQGLTNLKKSGIYNQNTDKIAEFGNNSFVDVINLQEKERISKLRQINTNNYHDNELHQQMKRDIMYRAKSMQRQEQQKHMKRLKQMQQQSQRNYLDIKRKHEQNMKLYDMHSSLQYENEQYRKNAQKFTQCQQDIISRLKRQNQSSQRKRVYKSNQQILKSQMDQYNGRRQLQKSQIIQGHNIDESIFKDLLHGSPDNRKWYGQQLKSQMSEIETKRIGEKKTLKQKYRIQGIYGGQHGRERQAQIQYIDRRLGLDPNQYNSANKTKDNSYNNGINNEEESPRIQRSRAKSNFTNYEQLKKSKQILEQKRLPNTHSNIRRYSVLQMSINNNQQAKQGQVNKKPLNNIPSPSIQAQAQLPKSPQIQKDLLMGINSPINNINISPINQNTNKNNAMNIFTNQGNIKKQDQLIYLHGQNNPDRKLYRSYDLVAGSHRYYG